MNDVPASAVRMHAWAHNNGSPTVAGIDRSITNPTAACKTDHASSGITSYNTATAFRTNQTWNDGGRRTVSRRNKHSRSARKIKQQREKYSRGNANDREYAEWLLAKKVREGADAVCIERLNLEAMTRYGGRHKRGLNRGMRFIRHGAMLRKIRIVAERLGIRVIKVNPRGTSQECSVCGYTDGENRDKERFGCLKQTRGERRRQRVGEYGSTGNRYQGSRGGRNCPRKA